MGVVYEARQEHPRRTVALKVIRSGLPSENMVRRFQHEAEVLGQLQHPGIAHIYEAGVASVGTEGVDTPPFAALTTGAHETVAIYDLTYYDRHIAGNLESQIDRFRDELGVRLQTEHLRAWAMIVATMPSMRSVLFFLPGLRFPAASVSTATFDAVQRSTGWW